MPVLQAYVAQAAVGFAVSALGSCIVLAARDLGVEEAHLGWLASAFGVGSLVVGAAGRWVLRSGLQRALRTGAAVMAVGVTLVAVGPGVVPIVAGGLLAGLGAAALVLVTPLLLAGPDTTHRLSRATAGSSAAGVMAPAVLGSVDLTGVTGRTALLVVVIPLVAVARSARRSDPDDVAPPVLTGRIPVGVARRWAAIVLAVAVEFCFVVWGAGRLTETGVGDGAAAALASAFPVGLAVGRLAVPPLMRRGWAPVTAGAAATAAGTALLVAAPGPGLATLALVVAGIGVAPLYPVLLGDLLTVPGLAAWRAAALSTMASGTAILAAPAVLGVLGDAWGLRISFLVTLPLLGALVVVAGPRTGSTTAGHERRRSAA